MRQHHAARNGEAQAMAAIGVDVSSFQNLLSSFGVTETTGSSSASRLADFLDALASKMDFASPTGNVINATA